MGESAVRSLMQLAATLALLAVTWAAGEAAWTVRALRPKLAVTITNVDRATIAAGAAAANVEKASRAWNLASKQQASATTTAMSNVSAAAARLSTFVFETDKSLNSILLPRLTKFVADQDATLSSSQEALRGELVEMRKATAAAQKVLVDADAQVTNPDIAATLHHLATTADETSKTVTDVRQIADKARETYLKPIALWWAVVKELLPLAGSAAQVVK